MAGICFSRAKLSIIILFLSTFLLDASVPGLSGAVMDSSVLAKWRHYTKSGDYDSIVISAKPVYFEACRVDDRHEAFHAAVMIAQGYLFTEKVDSVQYWIDVMDRLGVEDESLSTQAIYYNVMAIFALKHQLDYSEALRSFLKGYEVATALDNSEYRVTLLSNIANVFYLRSDADGMKYAREAFDLVHSSEVSQFAECLAYMAMAQMFYLQQDYESALSYVHYSDSLVNMGDNLSLAAPVEVLYGDIYSVYGDFHRAEEHYKEALMHTSTTEPGMVSLIYLNYGKCCELSGSYDDAIVLYEEGLEVSRMHGNVEFRRELLQRLTDLYCGLDDADMFRTYYKLLRESYDSMADREREFNALMLSNQQVRHELELKSNELELLKVRRNAIVWGSVSIIAIMLTVVLLYLWRRQMRMYKILVDQHYHYIRQIEDLQSGASSESVSDTGDENVAEKLLFEKVKKLMIKDKIFKQKDITLDRIAELTDSNRTYVSKAINHFAGQSFPAFLNMYRISEATKLISDFDRDLPLKQVADEVGYTSMSVFYSAFCKETGVPPGRYRKELLNRKNIPDS